jgi:hypothetical protein
MVLPWAMGARRRVWVVLQRAWRERGGPVCSWLAPASGVPGAGISYYFGSERPSAAAIAELGRGADLLLGRGPRPGRRSRFEDGSGLDIAERANEMHRLHPSLTWAAIARRLNTTERSLRTYRADLAREQLGMEHRPRGPLTLHGEEG